MHTVPFHRHLCTSKGMSKVKRTCRREERAEERLQPSGKVWGRRAETFELKGEAGGQAGPETGFQRFLIRVNI